MEEKRRGKEREAKNESRWLSFGRPWLHVPDL
jgi:hypothetical protein